MRKYKITDAIFLSFYSRNIYSDVYVNWKGLGIAYLLVVIIFFSLGELIKLQKNVTSWVVDKGPGISAQVPEIWINRGIMHHNAENPKIIFDPMTSERLVLIDTTLIHPDSVDYLYSMVLGRNKMMIRNDGNVQIMDLSEIESFVLNSDMTDYWFQIVGNWFVILIGPFLVIFSWIIHLFVTAFFALIAWVYIRANKRNALYPAVFRVTAVALTPMLLIQALSGLVDIPLLPMDFMTPLVGAFYTLYAAKIIMENSDNIPKDRTRILRQAQDADEAD